ncbi:MAG: YCF48-related protein, partial [Bryobacteraceae bacterium]|nr:YCF48-related protein [Bryobacteraceae bacterium]
SADGGLSWRRQASFTTSTLRGVFFLDERRGWAVGWTGTLLYTTDGGRFWEQSAIPGIYFNLEAVHFRDPQNGWIVGAPG